MGKITLKKEKSSAADQQILLKLKNFVKKSIFSHILRLRVTLLQRLTCYNIINILSVMLTGTTESGTARYIRDQGIKPSI